MTAMEAAESLYQNELVPLFADKKIKRPDKFRVISLFVEIKTCIRRGADRGELKKQYLNLKKNIKGVYSNDG